MRYRTDAAARLIPLATPRLPDWCDPYLSAPGSDDFFAGRAWYDTLLAQGVPKDAEPVLALCGPGDALLLPLLRQSGRLTSLAAPYTLSWRPLPAPGADAAALHGAGRGFGRLMRFRPPVRLDAMEEAAGTMVPVRAGLRAAGLALGEFRHFGNWHEPLAPGLGWQGYLADRPPVLRSTIQRKLARAARESCFTCVTAPGPALEQGILAYQAVRARSWKPPEPFPDFDAALMRQAASIGALRLGLLRRPSGQPLAAQYWVVSGGCATLLKLAHDAAEKAASPGTALTALMIRLLIERDAVETLDFGRGDDPYKQLWATRRRQRIGLMVNSPCHPAGLAELAREAAGFARRSLRAWRAPEEAA